MGGERLDSLARRARDRLRAAGVETPDLDARLLTEWATGASRLDLISAPDRLIDADKVAALDAALTRRCQGEPVHRIMGVREFYGLPFRLSPGTLEPRPDTEVLVDLLAPVIAEQIARNGFAELVDMGTGTGAIVIALLHRFPGLRGVGVDISDDALATARINAAENGVSARFAAVKSDWFEKLSGRFHFIASNPPYIPRREIACLSREVRDFDPVAALDGGEDGLDFYRVLASHSGRYLYPDGRIAVEIGAGQFDDVETIFAEAGFVLAGHASDLGGHRRAMMFAVKQTVDDLYCPDRNKTHYQDKTR